MSTAPSSRGTPYLRGKQGASELAGFGPNLDMDMDMDMDMEHGRGWREARLQDTQLHAHPRAHEPNDCSTNPAEARTRSAGRRA
jgi:hypothetical protein